MKNTDEDWLQLNKALADPRAVAMNFLNEVADRYPSAISFAPGRPSEKFFEIESFANDLKLFLSHVAKSNPRPESELMRWLGQYNSTSGIIREIVAEMLERDEGIVTAPESIMVTVGAQEAMIICLIGLFRNPDEVLLTADPAYFSIGVLAKMLGIRICPVRAGNDGLDLEDLRIKTALLKRQGKRPKLLYDVFNFSNPLGSSLPLRKRHELLEIAMSEEFLILEDNPYGLFNYGSEHLPTLKSLDRTHSVIYVGTVSKTMFPSLRLGYLVTSVNRVDELSKVKSVISVNTSPLIQGIVAGRLLRHGCSQRAAIVPAVEHYKKLRDRMIASLACHLSGQLTRGVSWNTPAGGFFLNLTLPFTVDQSMVSDCVDRFGVIFCPMNMFMHDSAPDNRIRLSFSYVSEREIEEGVRRLAAFIKEKLRG